MMFMLPLKINSGWCACLLASLLSACTAGPDFVRPAPQQITWNAPLPHGGKVESLLHWWQQWDDAELTRLIEQAEQHNPTLDMAVAKLAEARAQAGVSDAASYPSIGASAGVARSKMVFGSQVLEQTQGSFGFDAGWELDLFGAVRRGKEAAQARMQAGAAGWHAARVSLAAEVAGAYVELRSCEAETALAEKELASRRATRDLIELRHGAGFASTADGARSQAAWQESASALVVRQGDCARQLNRLAALTGLDYAGLQQRLQARHGQLPAPQQIAFESVAAQALSQRPDVAGAESEWAAASADIGVAKAVMLPSLNLLGSIGVSRLLIAGGTTDASTWSFGPALKFPVFDGGGNSGRLKAAQARYDYAQANYRKTVRAAVQEIEDALVRLDVANRHTAQSRDALEHHRIVAQAGNVRRDAGMENQLDVEEVQRSAWLAEDALVGGQRDSALAWIALYKALGGGWQDEAAMEGKR
ncbi:MAG: efflux transporter outer membrane subunit [Nitrosomonadales bacterium]|nr:efflux transporter outer membrane subunit [Nitrosomonadales bacterium]